MATQREPPNSRASSRLPLSKVVGSGLLSDLKTSGNFNFHLVRSPVM